MAANHQNVFIIACYKNRIDAGVETFIDNTLSNPERINEAKKALLKSAIWNLA